MIQSDDVTTYFKQKMELNEIILSDTIDRILAIYIKHSIYKIHKISTILQGIY